ncbi:glycosyltransferase [Flammeovirga yaeyamensis]|uniref:Glycosyltransferase n=1 Tax=Flammeovirga yaeyamensis TaxID=367791 RepID=A0AAX1N276_9BACT|nr:glycosyltransferase family 4 protein [Flammeovirga yaeyamensis]MBB3696338.1 glycosyltransferase involved in cell wall biosynthesis [Flammeovirga yaeyamensis]NMF35017.1 glycosyltransferase family 4 protein [Flammeovirga yaeyamensis]QWG00157.1 glycosyltransferase [Flammeovirga yaeyamensis]
MDIKKNIKDLKIQHIFYSGLGGHGNVFFSLIKAQNSTLFKNEVLLYGIEKPRQEYIEKFKKNYINFKYVKKNKGIDFFFWFNIYKSLNKNNDIFFLHGSYNIIPVFIFSLIYKKKIIVRETQANHLKSTIEWILLFFSFLFSNKIIFLSLDYENELKKKFKFLFPKTKTNIIPNGIDLDLYYKIKSKNSNNILKIGMLSRIVPIKDHKTLIKSICKISNKNIILSIAGEGESTEYLKKLVADLEMNNVIFEGLINSEQIPAYLKSLDIYVHATLGETMSTSIMQAQASGLPIIATNVNGVNNVIIDNINGLLVEKYNIDSYVEKINLLINNENLRKKFANESLLYSKRLSNEIMADLYNEIMINL